VTRSEDAEPADELFLVAAARQVWAGQRSHEQFHAVFNEAIVYAERTQQPGVLIWDLGERGRWTVVFSDLQRLAAHAGACSYLATTGTDFLKLVPDGVGVMLDPNDEHRFPVLTLMASPQQLSVVWTQAASHQAR
jgi:hypothetical protein